jgi:hypothetical protein
MVLKYVEQDDDYRALLHRCLAEVGVHSELLRPGMELMQGFVFISSAGSVTPYHMDPEHNFLLQVRGSKTVSLFDGRDRSIVIPDAQIGRDQRGIQRTLGHRSPQHADALKRHQERVRHRRDQVRRRRARRHHRHAGTTRDVGVALRHVPCALLMAYEDVADRRVEQRVVGRQDPPTGQPEHDLDPLHLEGFDEGLRPGQLHDGCPS